MPKYRSVRKVLPRDKPHWVGNGFYINPVFADSAFTEDVSPLLLFDYAAPKEFPSREGDGKRALGVGQHPHRGFETVTVAFQGEIEHKDTTGESGLIGEGDVQWMTAGRGIVHQELHSERFSRTGGTMEMCQLWVNLRKTDKMTNPRYQAILKDSIPNIQIPVDTEGENVHVTVRLIAGKFGDTEGAASTFSPVQMWDVLLPAAKAECELPYPSDQNCILFVRKGSVEVLSSKATDEENLEVTKMGQEDVALMNYDESTKLKIRATENCSSLMIMGGEPFHEPIVNEGPFVMNTQEEIWQAVSDYRMGKMGKY